MKNIVPIIAIALIIGASFIIFRRVKRLGASAAYTVGILQTASHPALDAARDGFVAALTQKMGNSVAFAVHNAQGSVAQAHAIAQQLHANKQINGFFAIATPAAQAMSAVEKERPIIIAAVTDPAALGLIYPHTNVCGTKDMIDVKSEIDMLIQLVPKAKQVGLLYTAGEVNSIALVKQMRSELEARGLQATDFALSSEAELPTMVELACRKADVILAPTDNTVASAITIITAIALKHKKPLVVSDNMLVKHGALAARGVDYKESGAQAAQVAYQVLVEGKKPSDLPIEQAKSEKIFINRTTLAALGLIVPQALQHDVVFVG